VRHNLHCAHHIVNIINIFIKKNSKNFKKTQKRKQTKGVDDVIRKIDGNPFETPYENVIFLSRPRMDIMKNLAKQILAFKEKQQEKKIYLFLVPRRTLMCEMVLERAGVYNMIEKPISEFSLDLIPFDNDVRWFVDLWCFLRRTSNNATHAPLHAIYDSSEFFKWMLEIVWLFLLAPNFVLFSL